ncbi:MAG: hypothetical protein U0Z44_22355 [Kouleothrix sp.]|jgi:hypothetical protein|nr:hypothetical protein [Kouleothrix sp.]
MNGLRRNRWLIVLALVAAGWLIWARLHVVFVVQLNLWSMLLIFGLLVLGIFMALKWLRAP